MPHPGLAIAAAAFLAAACVLGLLAAAVPAGVMSPLSFVNKAFNHHQSAPEGPDNEIYPTPEMKRRFDERERRFDSIGGGSMYLDATPALADANKHHHGRINVKANGKAFTAPHPLHAVSLSTPEMKHAVQTHLAVPYGTDSKQQVLNFWEAPGDGPRPLVIMIHGGGWANGDYREFPAHGFINQGISYASIDYRMLNEVPLPVPVMDAARALQHLKHYAAHYNIDKRRIILTGHSAGGLSALYLNYHDDLADPHSDDPVLRESTRVLASAVASAQTSIDPEVVRKWGLGPTVLEHTMLRDSVGYVAKRGLAKKQKALLREFSPMNHVDSEDPPVFLTTMGDISLPCKDITDCIHHHEFARRLKMRADSIGARVYSEYHHSMRKKNGEHFLEKGDWISRPDHGGKKHFTSPMEFILDQFGMDYAAAKKADKTDDWCGKAVITWLC